MLTPDEAQRLGQKYMERRGAITDTMIARHLAGVMTLAAPAAVDNRAQLLPLDVDAGKVASDPRSDRCDETAGSLGLRAVLPPARPG